MVVLMLLLNPGHSDASSAHFADCLPHCMQVTLCIVGARYALRVGLGVDAMFMCELLCAAPTAAAAEAAPSRAGDCLSDDVSHDEPRR